MVPRTSRGVELTVAQRPERDFPLGHPAAVDTVIGSPAHRAWEKQQQWLENQRDFPPGHPKAVDTPGHTNATTWAPGVDPLNPHHEAFTGHPPEKAAAVAQWNKEQAAGAHESPVLKPVDATVANEALAARRKELGVDSLTADEHAEVLATLQGAPHGSESYGEMQARVEREGTIREGS